MRKVLSVQLIIALIFAAFFPYVANAQDFGWGSDYSSNSESSSDSFGSGTYDYGSWGEYYTGAPEAETSNDDSGWGSSYDSIVPQNEGTTGIGQGQVEDPGYTTPAYESAVLEDYSADGTTGRETDTPSVDVPIVDSSSQKDALELYNSGGEDYSNQTGEFYSSDRQESAGTGGEGLLAVVEQVVEATGNAVGAVADFDIGNALGKVNSGDKYNVDETTPQIEVVDPVQVDKYTPAEANIAQAVTVLEPAGFSFMLSPFGFSIVLPPSPAVVTPQGSGDTPVVGKSEDKIGLGAGDDLPGQSANLERELEKSRSEYEKARDDWQNTIAKLKSDETPQDKEAREKEEARLSAEYQATREAYWEELNKSNIGDVKLDSQTKAAIEAIKLAAGDEEIPPISLGAGGLPEIGGQPIGATPASALSAGGIVGTVTGWVNGLFGRQGSQSQGEFVEEPEGDTGQNFVYAGNAQQPLDTTKMISERIEGLYDFSDYGPRTRREAAAIAEQVFGEDATDADRAIIAQAIRHTLATPLEGTVDADVVNDVRERASAAVGKAFVIGDDGYAYLLTEAVRLPEIAALQYDGRLSRDALVRFSPEVLPQLVDYTTVSIIRQQVGVAENKTVLESTVAAFNKIDQRLAQSDIGGAKPRIGVNEVIDTTVFHTRFSPADEKYYSERPSGRAAGVWSDKDGQVIVTDRNCMTCVHEYIHKSQYDSYPEYREDLRAFFGGNELILIEAVTQFTAVVGLEAVGRQEDAASARQATHPNNPLLSLAETQIIPAIELSGYSRRDAEDIVLNAGRNGDYQTLIDAVGINKLGDMLSSASNIPSNYLYTVDPADLVNSQVDAARRLLGITLSENVETGQPQSFLHLVDRAFAAEGNSGLVFDGLAFETLLRAKLVKEEMRDGKVHSSTIKDIIKKDLFQQSIEEVVNGKFILTTGRNGQARGSFTQGFYKVEVDAISGVDVEILSVIQVTSDGIAQIPVVLKPGSGQIVGLSLDKDLLVEQVVAADNEVRENVVVGLIDKDGNSLPWAGIEIKLSRLDKEQTIHLDSGWNLVTLGSLPAKVLTAYTLANEIAGSSENSVVVSELFNGYWKSVLYNNGQYSGLDFVLNPGSAYFIRTLNDAEFVYRGQDFVAPVEVKVKPGWNSFGIPYFSRLYNAKELLGNPNLSSDVIGTFSEGSWSAVLQHDGNVYGEDFTIMPKAGYIIRAAQNGVFVP